MKKRKKEKGAAQIYLEQIERLKIQIDRKKDKAELLYCLATKSTASMNASGAAGGGNPDKMAGVTDGYMDLKKEIDRDEQQRERLISEACDLLARLTNKQHYDVLKSRYLYYMPFTQIAVDMKYTYRGICILHGRALQEFEKVLEAHRQTEDEFKRAIWAAHKER
jgi:hypothetical protein